jgi:hypothetical protein
MLRSRYDMSGHWFKGNTHIHSTASDGSLSFAELGALYASGGYDFLFRTDHWVTSAVAADTERAPLLWLDGVELDGCDDTGANFHVVCLGSHTPLTREMGFLAALESARAQGCLCILAHPHWCGNSLADALRWEFDGVEVYNHVCRWLNGKSNGTVHWEAMLLARPGTLAFAVDDAHLRPEHFGWNGGWVVVNAPACTREALLPALRAGNFYASCGPAFHDITLNGAQVTVRTSPVKYIRLVGDRWCGIPQGATGDSLLTEATITLPDAWPYAYLELEDAAGNRAWSNTLRVEHLS